MTNVVKEKLKERLNGGFVLARNVVFTAVGLLMIWLLKGWSDRVNVAADCYPEIKQTVEFIRKDITALSDTQVSNTKKIDDMQRMLIGIEGKIKD